MVGFQNMILTEKTPIKVALAILFLLGMFSGCEGNIRILTIQENINRGCVRKAVLT